jgi:hypothetical protein
MMLQPGSERAPRCLQVGLSLLLATAVLTWGPRSAQGRAGSSRVEQVKQLYDKLFFDDAMKVCKAVLDSGRNPRRDHVRLLTYKGLLEAVGDSRKRAVEAFKQVLVIDPLFDLGKGHPPRVRRAIAAARRWFRRNKPLMIELEAPEHVDRRGTARIGLKVVSDPLGLLKRAVLHVRAGDSGGFRVLPMELQRGAGFGWRVPLAKIEGAQHARQLQLYVSGLDVSYNEVAIVGSPEAPRDVVLTGAATPLVAVAPPPRRQPAPAARPWYRRWWIWAAAGAVLAATAITIGATAGGPEDRVDAPISIVPQGAP